VLIGIGFHGGGECCVKGRYYSGRVGIGIAGYVAQG
jgi:hypothetical protein